MDADDSTFMSYYFCHPGETEVLCQAPPHTPWKQPIASLNLSKDKESLLNSRIQQFSSSTEICSFKDLDKEWLAIVKYAMSLAGVTEQEIQSYVLHYKLDPGSQALEGSASSSAGVAVEPSWIAPNAHECAQDSLAHLIQQRQELAAIICQTKKRIKALETAEKLCLVSENWRRQRKTAKYSYGAQTTGFDKVSHAMDAVYRLAPFWCQRLCCRGFTSGRKSSSWSEAINSQIRSSVSPKFVVAKHAFGLSKFVPKFDLFVDGLCQTSFESKIKNSNLPGGIFGPEDISFLQKYLSHHAVSEIQKNAGISTHSCTFHSLSEIFSPLCKQDVSTEMLSRVNQLCAPFGIEDNELKFYRVYCSSASDSSEVGESVICVYKAADGMPSKIDYFIEPAEKNHGVVIFCSCQKQVSCGLACPHQLRFIQESRSLRNVVWLTHPTFIIGYEKQNAAQQQFTSSRCVTRNEQQSTRSICISDICNSSDSPIDADSVTMVGSHDMAACAASAPIGQVRARGQPRKKRACDSDGACVRQPGRGRGRGRGEDRVQCVSTSFSFS